MLVLLLRKVNGMGQTREHVDGYSTGLLVLLFVTGLLLGTIITGYITFRQISRMDDEVKILQNQISRLNGTRNITYQSVTVIQNATALSQIYNRVKDSVVLIRGRVSGGSVQGSGFVYNFYGAMVVITNNHVVSGTSEKSVTFSDGNGYAAVVNGTDPYSDLAVLTVIGAPESQFKPLEIVSSSTLKVGDPTIAVGNPYGLVGSMTTGVISALGRTIREQNYTGGYAIANIIQTSAPINPGNSGGPLLNYDGKVIGITTAIVADSQGLGFAVPSNTILREVFALVNYREYTGHSYLGVTGKDMDYETAQNIRVNVTYGWRIDKVIAGGPAYNATIMSNDIIIGINGTRVRNGDEMTSYLEEYTLPNETVVLTIARRNQISHPTDKIYISVRLGTRPPPP
jgi:S1-C subfamily serine protease